MRFHRSVLVKRHEKDEEAPAAAVAAMAAAGRQQGRRSVSLTRALNSASNRAVRRILLSRSWPSAEALNLSLRQVLAAGGDGGAGAEAGAGAAAAARGSGSSAAPVPATVPGSTAKCPVPRPILRVITRRRNEGGTIGATVGEDKAVVTGGGRGPAKRSRTDEEWISEQLGTFRASYGALPAYGYADAYLECILCLATSGVESPRAPDVIRDRVYDEAYLRIISVLRSVGVVFEDVPPEVEEEEEEEKEGEGTTGAPGGTGAGPPRKRISKKLVDKDICLSMMDKLAKSKEGKGGPPPSSIRGRTEVGTDPPVDGEGPANGTVAAEGAGGTVGGGGADPLQTTEDESGGEEEQR